MSDYPKKNGKGESTITGYSVEGRCTSHDPKMVGDQIIDNRWRRINSPIGIPAGLWAQDLKPYGLSRYSEAQAIRWRFHAIADAALGGLCIETKIIKHVIKSSYECNAVSEHKIIRSDDRSNSMPDWANE